MPEDKNPPRPHGDKLDPAIGKHRNDPGENRAQVQSDAAPDAVGAGGREVNDREGGSGSTANGVPASDGASGDKRKKQYRDGADLVSGID